MGSEPTTQRPALMVRHSEVPSIVGGKQVFIELKRRFGLRPIQSGKRMTLFRYRDIESAVELYAAYHTFNTPHRS